VLKPADFHNAMNKDIFATMVSMFSYSQKIDMVTVLDKLREGGRYSDELLAYARDLMFVTPTSANVMEYAAIVKDKSLLRAIADAGSHINALAMSGEGGAAAILEAAEMRVFALREGRSSGLVHVFPILTDVYGQIAAASKSGGDLPGIPTGFRDLDDFTMGLNKSDLVLIASRPGMGKTSIALSIALHAARTSGKAVAVFSLEMSREQLALRLLSSHCHIDGKDLQTGRVKQENWGELADAVKTIGRAELLINDDSSLTVADMNAQCRRVDNLGLVVIDYLQLMQSASGPRSVQAENRVQVVSEISRMMKIMAKELCVPVVCLSQLNRANEARTNKRPMLSDLRDSGSIEQDADVVIGLYRDDYYDAESTKRNIVECIVLKNRRGNTGQVELQWMPQFTAFSSLERTHEG
jgi:replicative DNA helicase